MLLLADYLLATALNESYWKLTVCATYLLPVSPPDVSPNPSVHLSMLCEDLQWRYFQGSMFV